LLVYWVHIEFCVWTIVHFAEGPMGITGATARIAGDIPGHARTIGSQNALEAKSLTD
jgi:hypothetical protein